MTPWLAENLDRIGDVIGLPNLDLIDTEVSVDNFAADILARDMSRDRLVLIENQLECSDHTHLGQVLTYVSGLQAQVMVWIAPRFRAAHLSAVRWLNENTVEPFAFFAIRVRVVQIGDSPLAPLFELVEQPDDWERQVQATLKKRGNSSADAEMRQAFWQVLSERHPNLVDSRPYAASSRWLPTTDPQAWLSLFFSRTGAGLFVRGPREDEGAARTLLIEYADALSAQLGIEVEPDGRFFMYEKHSVDMTARSNWPGAIDRLAERAAAYREAIDKVLRMDAL